MSGADVPEVVIGGAEQHAVERLLTVLVAVHRELAALGRELVLVGGLAVAVRVARADRVTTDIDSVFGVGESDIATVEVLAAAEVGTPAGADAPQRRIVDGVAVDCIDTIEIDDEDLTGIDDRNALFVGGHRFACVTAERVAIRSDAQSVRVYVATPAGLVATKLHAARYRACSEKLGGDLLDLYQLLTRCDNVAMATALGTWPRLAALVRASVTELFDTAATRSASRIASTGALPRAGADNLVAAAQLFGALFDSARRPD